MVSTILELCWFLEKILLEIKQCALEVGLEDDAEDQEADNLDEQVQEDSYETASTSNKYTRNYSKIVNTAGASI